MENIYMLADYVIQGRIGERIKSNRLRQNIMQRSLAESAGISLSTLKKIEAGEIGSFDSFLRVIRTLGMLDIFQPLVEEEQMSPVEYWNFVNSAKRKKRKRAGGKLNAKKEEKSTW